MREGPSHERPRRDAAFSRRRGVGGAGGRDSAARSRHGRRDDDELEDARDMSDEAAKVDRLRVATLNVWNKSGPWLDRRTLIREQLEELAPDIVGLQEILELRVGDNAMNQADELLPEGFHRAYGASHEMSGSWVPEGQHLLFGNALLSRFPIRAHFVHPLPGEDLSDQKRTLLHAVLETPFGVLDVFVTHLNWKLEEGWIRERQVKEIARLIGEKARDDGRSPPLLMGDLNAEPQSDEIRYLGGYTRLGEERTVRFTDVWSYGGVGPGHTFDTIRNRFAGQYPEPPRRIDYIFVRGPAHDGRGRPMRPRIWAHRDENEIFPSDHFGVACDFAV
ncbi:MAG: hypothetical protein CMN31_09590 [Sandaracinus sp.]|nr:hypothetical protein [Sandaracinus sp.]